VCFCIAMEFSERTDSGMESGSKRQTSLGSLCVSRLLLKVFEMGL
jgi:hypothetical protein